MNRMQLAIYLLNIIEELLQMTNDASETTIAKVDAMTQNMRTETAIALHKAWSATCRFAYAGDWWALIDDHDDEWTPDAIEAFKATYPGLL